MKKLILLKIDFRILTSIKVGFMKEMISKKKELTSIVPIEDFRTYLSSYHASFSKAAEDLLIS